ncbi:hypothetical protein PAXRUDRAFT_829883 [Paxillus rubicundulus Ve08.2h10]|uniref:Uncharacterized protein n=1 Tax=Paxillus rubicundulus Ve08.2h10 TaxID=930991 RepID=A0A0D0DM09_9AGAM|nr:hypothetical protein PAXRUDRAFT_829883 [Paxillus rubicundulus Ve08.2h10]
MVVDRSTTASEPVPSLVKHFRLWDSKSPTRHCRTGINECIYPGSNSKGPGSNGL